jgi:hypothetical protein
MVGAGDAAAQREADHNAFLDILPALRGAPAPAWLAPGTRISYFSSAASIAAERTKLVEDPEGSWVVTASGKRYREEDISGAGKGNAGYTVVNVVYLDESVAVLDLKIYSINPTAGGGATIGLFMGVVGLPGAGSDFWLHPQVLARAPGIRLGEELKVLRMGYALGQRQHQVVRFQGKNSSWSFDDRTGLLLRSTTSAETTVLVPPPGTEGPIIQRPGGSLISQNTLMDVRTPAIPWSKLSPPAWVAQARKLVYDGSWAMNVPGAPTIPIPMRVVFERRQFGGKWARYDQHVFLSSGPGLPPIEHHWSRAFGSAQIGGLWVPPASLARLRAGQVLDRDPVTHEVTTVTGDAGGNVAITESNELQRIDYLYDRRDGRLVGVRQLNGVLNSVVELRLTGMD